MPVEDCSLDTPLNVSAASQIELAVLTWEHVHFPMSQHDNNSNAQHTWRAAGSRRPISRLDSDDS